ncbi:MFS transporter [Rhodococcus olei]|uniref:MFS transporter n=1 Tax=Rhodococcus olei TaxID=2161675 RepID=A0ABP8P749_9NOCA
MTVPTEASGPPAPSSDPDDGWTPRLVLSLASMLVVIELLSVSYGMVSVDLPAITTHFATDQGAWLLTAFLLVGAVISPMIGKLADLYGKRRLLLISIAVATAGSLISALAPSYGVLVAGRALQGFLIPCMFLVYSLVRDVFPRNKVALAVSIATSGLGLVAIPAPWLTGWLIETWGFRSIFWFFVICLVFGWLAIVVTTPETPVRLQARVDIVGGVLLGLGIAGVLAAVSFGPRWGWTDISTLAYLLGGVALLIGWVVHSRTVSDPLIDLRFFRRRSVLLTGLAAGCAYATTAAYAAVVPMMVMVPAEMGLGYGLGMTAKQYAIVHAPSAAAGLIGGLLVGTAIKKLRPRILMIVGLLVMSSGVAATAFAHDTKLAIVVVSTVTGFGSGMVYACVPNLIIAAVPPQLQATTSSLVSVMQSGFAAILPVIVFAVLNSHVAMVAKGRSFYTETGMSIALFIGAGVLLVGALLACGLPSRITQLPTPRSDAGVAGTGKAVAHA